MIAEANAILPRPRRVEVRKGQCSNDAPLRLRFERIGRPQSFRLRIDPLHITLSFSDAAGLRYGLSALAQLRAAGSRIRCMTITDRPDFAVRGVMLDISRDKVPTMATLRRLVDDLSRLRINQLQLYTEHTFTYRGHERVWRGCSPMAAHQVRALDAYCAERGVELVPNQNSFGHMERWLKHTPYRRLAETTGPWKTPWGTTRDYPTTLCPLDPRSLRLVTGLYDQLLPCFRSRLLNVGCDETFELGQGRSAAACRRRGVGRVYLDYLLKLHHAVKKRGRRMMFWSDIIHQHPELIRYLPRDVIPLVWGYEADHPFVKQCGELRRCGLEFYVCPGTSSWCSFSGRTTNALANLHNAARAGRRHGATGYLITDWGDYGHRQYLSASYGPMLYGAAISWCAASNENIDVGGEVDRHFFGDSRCGLGPLWLAAGRVHEASGISIKNRTILFTMMDAPIAEIPKIKGLTVKRIAAMRRIIAGLRNRAAIPARRERRARRANAEPFLAHAELLNTLNIMDLACRRGEMALLSKGAAARSQLARNLAGEIKQILENHRRLWLARNRRGGLGSSLGHFGGALRETQ